MIIGIFFWAVSEYWIKFLFIWTYLNFRDFGTAQKAQFIIWKNIILACYDEEEIAQK
jgi:hypothetical protein